MNPAELLDQVTDRESFIRFVEALATEREQAEQMEREKPDAYRWGGALDWQHSDISGYLLAALSYFEEGPRRFKGDNPSWHDLAKFLYLGKIYE